jgi:hypothetical protein
LNGLFHQKRADTDEDHRFISIFDLTRKMKCFFCNHIL